MEADAALGAGVRFKPLLTQTWLQLLRVAATPRGLEGPAEDYYYSLVHSGWLGVGARTAAEVTAWELGLLQADESMTLPYRDRQGYAVVDHVSLPALPPSEVGEA